MTRQQGKDKGGELATRSQKFKGVRGLLEKSKGQFAAALPKVIDPARFMRIALTECQRTPKLLDCTQVSLIGSLMEAAQLGLEPGLLGYAYLVPYKGKCQLIPGYRGLVDLARRSGQIKSIHAEVVYQNDDFDFGYGDEPFIHHKPTKEENTGPVIAVYAVARFKDDGIQRVVLWKREIDAIRARSASANEGPWVTDYNEMAKKSALRRLCKLLPMTAEMRVAQELDIRADRGDEKIEILDIDSGVEPVSTLDAVAADLEQQPDEHGEVPA